MDMRIMGVFVLNAREIERIKAELPDWAGRVQFTKLQIRVWKDSPTYEEVKRWLEEHHYSYIDNSEAIYDKKEFEEAPLLLCIGKEIDYWGEEFGNEYRHVIGCDEIPRCYSVKEQVADLRLDTKVMRNLDFGQLLSQEVIISARFRKLLEDNGFSGIGFRPIIRYPQGDVSTDFYQVKVDKMMPPMSFEVQPQKMECTKCGLTSVILRLEQPMYNASVLADACDFNLTREYFGVAWPSRELVVTQRVRQLVKTHKLKGAYFLPIKVV